MLLYPPPALLAPFPRNFISKGNANNKRNLLSCPFPVIAFKNEEGTVFINEETIGAINEADTGSIIGPRNLPPCFFLFHVLLFQSHYQLRDPIYLMTSENITHIFI